MWDRHTGRPRGENSRDPIFKELVDARAKFSPNDQGYCCTSVIFDYARESAIGPKPRCVLGRACPLCPGISDVYLFSYRESVINLNAEVSDGAFDFCVTEQELYRP